MGFWIKYRFWIASGLFLIGCGSATFLLLVERFTILDEELRYAIALACIGTGFTACQFYFQINESRYQTIQSELVSTRGTKRLLIKELIVSSQKLLEIINTSLGSSKYEYDVFALERDSVLAYNELMIYVKDYYSIYFKDIQANSSTFFILLSGLTNAITNMRVEIEKNGFDGSLYNFIIESRGKNWRDFAKDVFHECELKRAELLTLMRKEVD